MVNILYKSYILTNDRVILIISDILNKTLFNKIKKKNQHERRSAAFLFYEYNRLVESTWFRLFYSRAKLKDIPT